MRSFLGVPVLIRGEAWGNLYLADKRGASEFTEADTEAVVILAEWAGIAIENARLYEASERRREQLERAVLGLEATRDVAIAIGGATGTERVLELIAKRGRALIDARGLLIMLRDCSYFVVARERGLRLGDTIGHRLPVAGSTSGLGPGAGPRARADRARPRSTADHASRARRTGRAHGAARPDGSSRYRSRGPRRVRPRGGQRTVFTEADEQLLQTFAASAASAVAMARSVEADRLRSSLAAADAERRRWARELHDDTLQVLGVLRVMLSSALRYAAISGAARRDGPRGDCRTRAGDRRICARSSPNCARRRSMSSGSKPRARSARPAPPRLAAAPDLYPAARAPGPPATAGRRSMLSSRRRSTAWCRRR